MSLRTSLKFRYAISEVKEATGKKLHYHSERLAHWVFEAKKAEEDAKKSVRTVSHAVTGGNQVTAILDPEKAQWLSQCQNKRDKHNRLVEEYEAWLECLPRTVGAEGQIVEAVVLDQDDAHYFGLLDSTPDD